MKPELIIVKFSRPAGVLRGKSWAQSRHPITAGKRWTKEENKTAISCYQKATKESNRGHRKRGYNKRN